MTKYDRNLLKPVDVLKFKRWMDDNALPWREGRGDFEIMQILVADNWRAVNTNASGAISTPPAIREMVQRFNKGLPYTGKVKRTDAVTSKELLSSEPSYLEELRDNVALRIYYQLLDKNSPLLAAQMAFEEASFFMAERAKQPRI